MNHYHIIGCGFGLIAIGMAYLGWCCNRLYHHLGDREDEIGSLRSRIARLENRAEPYKQMLHNDY